MPHLFSALNLDWVHPFTHFSNELIAFHLPEESTARKISEKSTITNLN